MAILHKNINNESDIHVPKWLPSANNGDYAFKNEKGELESIDELLLPAALNFVDGSATPPTTSVGDIYILSSGASVNSGWGSVALQDWVRYDGAIWNSLTPQKSSLCYDKTADALMSFNGTAWAAIGGGGGTDANAVHVNVGAEISAITAKATPTTSDIILIEDAADSNNKKKITIGDLPSSGGNTIYSANDSLASDRTIDLDGNSLSVDNQAGTNILKIQNDGTFSIGLLANASNEGNVSIGKSSDATGNFSTAIGVSSQATSNSSIALGGSSVVTGNNAVGLGAGSTASGQSAIAIGGSSNAILDSISIGVQTDTGARSTAVGSLAKGTGAYNVSLGYGAQGTGTNNITIGGRSCVNSAQRSILMSTSNLAITNSVSQTFLVNLNNATNALYIGQTVDSYFGGSGNFGIGTTTPTGRLTVQGTNTLSTASALQIYDGDGTPNLLFNFKNSGTLNMSSIPTSSTGLASGDIYSDGGTLKIV